MSRVSQLNINTFLWTYFWKPHTSYVAGCFIFDAGGSLFLANGRRPLGPDLGTVVCCLVEKVAMCWDLLVRFVRPWGCRSCAQSGPFHCLCRKSLTKSQHTLITAVGYIEIVGSHTGINCQNQETGYILLAPFGLMAIASCNERFINTMPSFFF